MPDDGLHSYVFPLAVLLDGGKQSIPHVAMVDPKRKAPETPSSKPHKKIKKTKVSAGG